MRQVETFGARYHPSWRRRGRISHTATSCCCCHRSALTLPAWMALVVRESRLGDWKILPPARLGLGAPSDLCCIIRREADTSNVSSIPSWVNSVETSMVQDLSQRKHLPFGWSKQTRAETGWAVRCYGIQATPRQNQPVPPEEQQRYGSCTRTVPGRQEGYLHTSIIAGGAPVL